MASLDTALKRSLEAELATDAVQTDPSIEAHQLAAELHREAGTWHAKAGNLRRAGLHQLQSKVHAHVAVQLADNEQGRIP